MTLFKSAINDGKSRGIIEEVAVPSESDDAQKGVQSVVVAKQDCGSSKSCVCEVLSQAVRVAVVMPTK